MADDALKSFVDYLAERLASVAKGRLDLRLKVRGDASGPLADAVNVVLASFRGLVLEVRSGSTELIDTVERGRETAESLGVASAGASRHLDEIAQGLRGMRSGLADVSAAGQASTRAIAQHESLSGECGQATARAAEGMESIRLSVQGASKRVKRLGESTQEIGDALRVIDDLADQTNVLAVNAAIQSAMAGEAGEGFAIIAEEIRRLATRAREGMREMEALVRSLHTESAEAMAAVEQTTAGVVSGAEHIRRSNELFTQLNELSAQARAGLGELEQGVGRQSRQLDELVRHVPPATQLSTSVSAYSKTLCALLEDTGRSASDLVSASNAYVIGEDSEMAEVGGPKTDTGTVVLKAAQLAGTERRPRVRPAGQSPA